MQEFRFRPRYGGIALLAIAVSAVLFATVWLAKLTGTSRTIGLLGTAMGVILASVYLLSPAWRLLVRVDDDGLEVGNAKTQRFRLAWAEIVRVVASPDTKTCFVDGGDPGRSLMVPGPGASAPYDIENKTALYDAILSHSPATVVETVDLLENADVEQAES